LLDLLLLLLALLGLRGDQVRHERNPDADSGDQCGCPDAEQEELRRALPSAFRGVLAVEEGIGDPVSTHGDRLDELAVEFCRHGILSSYRCCCGESIMSGRWMKSSRTPRPWGVLPMAEP